jgi:hypothetical protein
MGRVHTEDICGKGGNDMNLRAVSKRRMDKNE